MPLFINREDRLYSQTGGLPVCSGIYQRLGFRDLTEVREYVADATADATGGMLRRNHRCFWKDVGLSENVGLIPPMK